jgi:hypothetical protein
VKIWVVKARQRLKDGSRGWHWRDYLESDDPAQAMDWGGRNWIRSPESKLYIRTQLQPHDLVVCYQVDHRAILGLTRTASAGSDDPRGSGDYNRFDLVPSEDALVIAPPLPIRVLRGSGVDPGAFGAGRQGTVFPMNDTEFAGVVRAIRDHAPALSEDLRDWLQVANATNTVDELDGGDDGAGDLDAELDRLERELNGKSEIYVRRRVRALIRRDAALIRALKAYYGHRCQFPDCAAVIPMRSGGKYCEVAHVQAVAQGGLPLRANLVVLCPNHHKMLDYGDVKISACTRRVLKGTLNGKPFQIGR